ncbi:hypothetical protein [Aurantiacibacter zhengii]|uniref:Uncharacterized protein n=1 Tax=Aurantiacibacter zhengii TaxID=2307003 RepID=A0A418NN64_9SPHN|nr:hypothetical protein [Aurantiacibacter zhengii]RIV83056.1 hypothetical protein D2V07_17190 [Aurantiacibacter zhengii]
MADQLDGAGGVQTWHSGCVGFATKGKSHIGDDPRRDTMGNAEEFKILFDGYLVNREELAKAIERPRDLRSFRPRPCRTHFRAGLDDPKLPLATSANPKSEARILHACAGIIFNIIE